MKFPSPLYSALIVCEPTVSAEVLKLAVPETSVVGPAKVVAPSLKVIVPLGVPVAGETAVTVAVNVANCVHSDGLGDEVKATELAP